MSEQELKIGDKVKVMRQIGAKGTPTPTNGTIIKFNDIIVIGGEKTAMVEYDDGGFYPHRVSDIELI